MSVSISKAILVGGFTVGTTLLAGGVRADPEVTNHRADEGHIRFERVPEIPAKGLAAGLLLVIGGTAVIVGRRRRAR